ncbi:MAG: tetratricopeptide repeat protein, partial [Coprobacillus sp.]
MEKKLLDQLDIWHENDQYEEIVNMLNNIPKVNWDEEHYQRMASAKNNLSQYEEAVELLMEIEDTFTEKHRWYFKLGYAYFYLDQIEKAYDAFEEVLKYDENDEGTLSFIDECIRYLVVPVKDRPFSLRVEECWKTFVEKEKGLRELISHREDSHKILSYCEDIMNVAFKSCFFELGFNGEKFDLILSSEGNPVLMFKLVYFKSQAPQSVFENWNIIIGRQRSNDQYEFQMYNKRITMSDVSVFVENKED